MEAKKSWHVIVIVAFIVAVLIIGTVAVRRREQKREAVFQWPAVNGEEMSGNVGLKAAGGWIAVVSIGSELGPLVTGHFPWEGELLGMTQVQPSGAFTVTLSRSVENGECLEVWLSKHGKKSSSHWFLIGDNHCEVPQSHLRGLDLFLAGSLAASGLFVWRDKSVVHE